MEEWLEAIQREQHAANVAAAREAS
jgi:hypothetical protein